MKSRNIYLLSFVLSLSGACDTKDSVDPRYDDYFIKYYGLEGDQTGEGIIVTDAAIFMTGTSSVEGTRNEIYLVKTDLSGNVMWDKTYENDLAIETTGIVQDAAGNLFIAGNVATEADLHDFYVMKTGPEGEFIQEATFSADDSGIKYNDYLESISINADGEIILTGWTTNVLDKTLPSNIADVFSLRLTPELVPLTNGQWRRQAGFRESMDLGKKIIQARQGGRYFFIGTTDKADGTGITAQTNLISFPLQFDGQFPSGDVINGTTNIETAADIIPTSSGDVVAMWNSSTGFNSSTIYLAYANQAQDYQLQTGRSLPFNTARGNKIIQSRFGGYIILGEQINVNNNSDIFLVRTDQNFNVLWQRAFGGIDNETAREVAELNDGSIVLTGTVLLESQTKMFLIKTRENGSLRP